MPTLGAFPGSATTRVIIPRIDQPVVAPVVAERPTITRSRVDR
jgi:hypothetical protein